MTVLLTISETLDGSAIADSLETPVPPANLGCDLGSISSGSYGPIVNKTNNTGRQNLFIRHNAGLDPITGVATHIQQYGTDTAYAYGGADSALNDINTLKALGNVSGGSKNNADGLSGGLWIDMNAVLTDSIGSSQFDWDTNGYDSVGLSQGGDDTVRIYGDNNVDGLSLGTGFAMHSKAMVIDSNQGAGGDGVNGWVPTAPVTGQIGKNGDTAKGDNAHIKLRMYVRNDTSNGGIVQFEFVTAYSFTA